MARVVKDFKLFCARSERRLIWYLLYHDNLLISTNPILDLKCRYSVVPKKSIISEDFVLRIFDSYTINQVRMIDSTDCIERCYGPYYVISSDPDNFSTRFYEKVKDTLKSKNPTIVLNG